MDAGEKKRGAKELSAVQLKTYNRVFRNNRRSPGKTELVNGNKVPERRFCSRRSGFAPRGPLEVRFAPLESIFLFFLLDKGQCVNHLVEVVISMLERVVKDD